VVRGTEGVRSALRDGSALLVILAEDASETQRKKITGLLGNRETPSAVLGTREELGGALGGSPLSAVALTQRTFAAGFLKKLTVTRDASGRSGTEEDERTNAG
jgi:ribosomal protein L7Ae-like RNA K-turn-binding protein